MSERNQSGRSAADNWNTGTSGTGKLMIQPSVSHLSIGQCGHTTGKCKRDNMWVFQTVQQLSIGHIYLIDVLPCGASRNNRAVGNTVHSCTFREQWTRSSGLTREERKPYQVPVPPPTSIDIRYPLFLLLFGIYGRFFAPLYLQHNITTTLTDNKGRLKY